MPPQQYHPAYRRKTVTPALRNWLLDFFHVQPDSSEWRFLYYVLLGVGRDKFGSGGLVTPATLVAALEGVKWHTGYRANRFLDRMMKRFPTLKISYSGWSSAGRARTLNFTLPDSVRERLVTELATLAPEPARVYFIDGSKVNRHKRARARQEEQIQAEVSSAPLQTLATDDAILMRNYLNTLPPHNFTKLLENLERAKDAVMQLPPEKRGRELNLLENFSLQPMQFYGLSLHSPRLAILGVLGQLKTPIRKILTHHWTDVDLQNVQLAVNAKLWNLEKTQAFLQTGQNWWEELFRWFALSPDEALKRRFKDATYALCYGASKRTIRGGEDGEGGLGEHTERFFQNPIVQELWEGRQRMLKRITKASGATDAYGRWIPVQGKEITRRSVLAQVAQSYEQVLIAEIFKLAWESSDAFTIVLYQSDGVSILFQDQQRKELWLRRINDRINAKATELGIITALIW